MAAQDPCLGTFNAYRGDEVVAGPNPTLYHTSSTYGSSCARLALLEHASPWRSRCVDFYLASLSVEQVRLGVCFAEGVHATPRPPGTHALRTRPPGEPARAALPRCARPPPAKAARALGAFRVL